MSDILLESGTNEMELLTFSIGGLALGVNVAKVQSISQFDEELLTEVPRGPEGVMGMYIHREHTYPCMDLAKLLAVSSDNPPKPVLIVMEFNRVINCFKVDAVQRIHRINWEQFVPVSSVIDSDQNCIVGSVAIEGVDVLVLDMEKILSEIFPDLALSELTAGSVHNQDSGARGVKRVVFCEDSHSIRHNVVRLLHEAGYVNLQSFENGALAHDYLESLADEEMPDLLVSDIEMPAMDGLTLCRKVKNADRMKNMPVIMFSSLINEQMEAKCKMVGADGYITKPQMNELVGLLDQYLLNSAAVS